MALRRLALARRAGADETAVERTLRDAASRVASGWSTPVEAALQRGRTGTALVLSWRDAGVRRSVMAIAPETGGMEFSGALSVDGQPPQQRPLGRDPAPDRRRSPDDDAAPGDGNGRTVGRHRWMSLGCAAHPYPNSRHLSMKDDSGFLPAHPQSGCLSEQGL